MPASTPRPRPTWAAASSVGKSAFTPAPRWTAPSPGSATIAPSVGLLAHHHAHRMNAPAVIGELRFEGLRLAARVEGTHREVLRARGARGPGECPERPEVGAACVFERVEGEACRLPGAVGEHLDARDPAAGGDGQAGDLDRLA